MGSFYTSGGGENPLRPGDVREVAELLVDPGAELSSFPAPPLEPLGVARVKHERRLVSASGAVLGRGVGPATVHAGGGRTIDGVVSGEPVDPTRVGARTLEGSHLRVALPNERLVAAGPNLAATAT